MPAQCKAVATSTRDRCKRRSIPGSKYCLFHVEKVPLVAAALLSLVVGQVWLHFVPSDESRQLEDAREQLQSVRSQNEEAASTISALRDETTQLGTELAEVRADAAEQQVLLERRLRVQAEEIARLHQRTLNTVTGGGSFCYFNFAYDGQVMLLAHQGEYPLFDVSARVVDLDLHRALPRPFTLEHFGLAEVNLPIGTLAPGRVTVWKKGLDPAELPEGGLNIFFSARNGWFTQQLRFAKVDGRLRTAYRVIRDEAVILEEIPDDFPRGEDGNVEWH